MTAVIQNLPDWAFFNLVVLDALAFVYVLGLVRR